MIRQYIITVDEVTGGAVIVEAAVLPFVFQTIGEPVSDNYGNTAAARADCAQDLLGRIMPEES